MRNLFAFRRTFAALEKPAEPLLEDIDGRLACWACVLQEPDGRFRMWYQSVVKESVHDMAAAGVWGRGTEFGFFPERYPGAVPETLTSGVNITGHRGTAALGLCRADMQFIPGFELENCLPVVEDVVRGTVRWKERASIAELKGQDVHVLLQMAAGSFYAVRL